MNANIRELIVWIVAVFGFVVVGNGIKGWITQVCRQSHVKNADDVLEVL